MRGGDGAARGFRVVPVLLTAIALLGSLAVAAGVGPSGAGWTDLADVAFDRAEPSVRSIVLDIRLPRLLLATLVGAALAGAGVAFQAVLRNPLADPYILGVSGGSALGAVVFTAVVGTAALGASVGRPLSAFAGAIATLFVLFRLTRVRGRTGTTALLLVGVVLNAFDSALILFLITAGDPARFQGVLYFLVGKLDPPTWGVLVPLALFVGAGLSALGLLAHRLNVLSLGEEPAAYLGIDVERTLWIAVLAASLVTAAAVAFTGLIGFVGLMAPHAARTAFGSDHRTVLPTAVLGGGAFVVLADAVARTVAAPVEIPVGVVTALAGGPFFLALFLRRLRRG